MSLSTLVARPAPAGVAALLMQQIRFTLRCLGGIAGVWFIFLAAPPARADLMLFPTRVVF